MNTPHDLNKKSWYRLLKVVYFFTLFIALLFALAIVWNDAGDARLQESLAIGAISILLVAEIIKRAFYYVVLGKMFFKKNSIAQNSVKTTPPTEQKPQ